ncbi:MAG TPA: GNAT family N-acetyltransferase [Acidisarcina sp.]
MTDKRENSSKRINVRPATAADVPLMLALIRELALYEREPAAVVATEADLLRDGFGDRSLYECLIGEADGEAAGFALFFLNYSTWRGRGGIHLEDLFVRPEFRGAGLGRALIAGVAAIAVERSLDRLQWEVLEWNEPAIQFYRGLGAHLLDDWRIMRVTGDALATLGAFVGARNPGDVDAVGETGRGAANAPAAVAEPRAVPGSLQVSGPVGIDEVEVAG